MSDEYQLTKAQRMLRESVREFAQKKIRPMVMSLEEKEEFPAQVHKWFKKQELYGLAIKEKWGGSGAGCMGSALAIEQIAEVSGSCAILLGNYAMAPRVIMAVGNDTQKEKYLKKIAAGELIPCLTLVEPESGSDVSDIRTRAMEDGDSWRITGTKCFANLADVADLHIIFAKTDSENKKGEISAFIVEKNTQGLSIPRRENLMGCRAVHVCELKLDNVKVPRESMMGARGEGYHQALHAIESGRYVTAARSVGLAQGALDHAIEYAKGRIVFGQPVADLQAIQVMVANMAIQIEAARQLTYKTVSEIDRGNHKQALKLGCMAKCFAADTAVKVSNDALQLFGGYGYMEDYPIAQYYRDAKLLQISEGATQGPRMIVARETIK